jgi:hypothetical protein
MRPYDEVVGQGVVAISTGPLPTENAEEDFDFDLDTWYEVIVYAQRSTSSPFPTATVGVTWQSEGGGPLHSLGADWTTNGVPITSLPNFADLEFEARGSGDGGLTVDIAELDIFDVNRCTVFNQAHCGFSDTFNRTVTNGWGATDSGLSWEVTPEDAYVANGEAHVHVDQNSSGIVRPNALSPVDVTVFARTENATGGDVFYLAVEYLAASVGEVNLAANGVLSIFTSEDSTQTTLGFGSETPFGLRFVRSTPTTIDAYCWESSGAQPSTPTLTLTNPSPLPDSIDGIAVGGSSELTQQFEVYVNSVTLPADDQCGDCYEGVPTSPGVPSSPGGFGCETPQRLSGVNFATSEPYQPGTTRVFRGGMLQHLTVDYTESNPGTGQITFTTPVDDDPVTVCYNQAVMG